MAVYGVSPYALPRDIALGCMMNLNAAQSWKAMPMMLAIGAALGNKAAVAELRAGIEGSVATTRNDARTVIEQLKRESIR